MQGLNATLLTDASTDTTVEVRPPYVAQLAGTLLDVQAMCAGLRHMLQHMGDRVRRPGLAGALPALVLLVAAVPAFPNWCFACST